MTIEVIWHIVVMMIHLEKHQENKKRSSAETKDDKNDWKTVEYVLFGSSNLKLVLEVARGFPPSEPTGSEKSDRRTSIGCSCLAHQTSILNFFAGKKFFPSRIFDPGGPLPKWRWKSCTRMM